MVTIISREVVNSIKSDSNSLASDEVALSIEEKIYRIIKEDEKLDKPVFLFIKNSVIQKLTNFLAGNMKRPVSVGIAGQSASGKSTIAQDVIDSLISFQNSKKIPAIITRINTDDYYYDRSDMVKAAGSFAEFAKNYDLDVPAAFELDLLKKHVNLLLSGKDVMLPKYDMGGTAKRLDNVTLASPNKIIISEGLFCLTDIINDVFDLSIYVDVSKETQRERWFARAEKRDIVGDAAQNVFNNVISKAEIHVKPTSKNADIIINGEAERSDYKKIVNKFLNIVESLTLKNLI